MRVLYESHQDFYTRLANTSKTSLFVHELLPRTLAHSSQDTFESYLHEAMGYRPEHNDELSF